MSFKKLKEAIGDSNPDTLALIEDLEATQGKLTDRVSYLEKESQNAFSKRDTAIGELSKVKDLLGVSEITEDTIKALKKGDSSAEVQNLQAQLDEITNAKTTLEMEYGNYKNSVAMDQAITRAGIEAKAANPKTLDIIKGLLQEGASVLEDGTVGYKNADGTTMYKDGKPVTLEDRVGQIASDEAYFGLFKPQTPSGGGTPPGGQGGEGSKKANFGGSTEERTSAIQDMLDQNK